MCVARKARDQKGVRLSRLRLRNRSGSPANGRGLSARGGAGAMKRGAYGPYLLVPEGSGKLRHETATQVCRADPKP
jgi:hypothetical protein